MSISEPRRLLALAMATLVCVACAASAPVVLHYDPALVRLSGTIVFETYFGPPNYGENPDTDSKEQARFLNLDRPVSVEGDPTDELNSESVNDIGRIQLNAEGSLSRYLGKHVRISGTLYHSFTAHRHTDVLLTVRRIQIVR